MKEKPKWKIEEIERRKKILDPFWKATGIKKTGSYIRRMDEMFKSLFTESDITTFFMGFIRLGDSVRYGWQYNYLDYALRHKLTFYNISTTKKKDIIIIKIKRKTEKAFVAEKVAEQV